MDTGGTPVNATGIYLQGPNARILDNDISRTKAMAGHFSSGIQIGSSRGVVVENNRIDHISKGPGSIYGVRTWESSNVLVIGNRISMATIGVHYLTSSSGKYMNNITNDVTDPYSGGTDGGGNN